ncbi:MAG: MT-A70 family methyltransferase [bacterium]
MSDETSLAILSRAAQMLERASTIQEAHELKGKFLVAAEWANQMHLGSEAVQKARAYALRAERKMGEMLRETERAKGTDVAGRKNIDGDRQLPSNPPPTLSDLGLTKRESAEAQRLAAIPEPLFEEVASGAKSIAAVQREIRQESRREMAANVVEGKFAVILADPPWQYQNSGFDEAADSLYPTMPTEAICGMAGQVNQWATPSSVLFLWATNPMLLDALMVMEAWGFVYKTNIAWVKDRGRGKGWFLKSRHELLLIGVRAETPHPKERPDSAFMADRPAKHSQKPDEAYRLVEAMYDGPRLEMFSRAERDGWKAFGNEC